MPLNDVDKGYIWDMKEACEDIIEFTEGINYHQFEKNKLIKFAVERQLLVIGEAANHVSSKCREECKEIEWSKIIGLRNIIAHDYGDILTVRIWKIVSENVKDLVKMLESKLKCD
jgi:uncharacterized protein with HEPN domain